MANKLTLDDLCKIDAELLDPQIVAEVLGVSVKVLLKSAKFDPCSLGFHVIKIGKRIKFPRRAFIDFMEGNSRGKHQ